MAGKPPLDRDRPGGPVALGQQDTALAGEVVDLPVVVAVEGSGAAIHQLGQQGDSADVGGRVVVAVESLGSAAGIGEALVLEEPAGGHDRVVDRVDVAAAIDRPGARDELHRPLGAGHGRAPDPAQAGLHEVDRRQVVPVHAEAFLGLVVRRPQRAGRGGPHDSPRGQLVAQVGPGLRVHRAELPPGGDVVAHHRDQVTGERGAHPVVPPRPGAELAVGHLLEVPRGGQDVGPRARVGDGPLRGHDLVHHATRRSGSGGLPAQRLRQLGWEAGRAVAGQGFRIR